jgi:hypothetical protein
MLTIPSVFIRAAGAGQDAYFATYGLNGLTLTTAATTLSLGTSSAGTLATIAAGTAVASGSIDVLALTTRANITPRTPLPSCALTTAA